MSMIDRLGLAGLLLAASTMVSAADLSQLTNADAVGGLKQALLQGSAKAVGQLGAQNGFLGDPKVKIPLPKSLKKIEKGLKFMGLGQQSEDLVVSMNHAAELAVREAKPVLTAAVKQMSVQDAKGILTGGDTAATEYFKRATSGTLSQKFLPIVKRVTAKIQLGQQYDALATQGAKLGLVASEDSSIDAYVTRKALDGLFLIIGEQERSMRKDPLGTATGLAKKVFGALVNR